MQIGGKIKRKTPAQPQFVVQRTALANEYMKIAHNEDGEMEINWVGDPNAATQFDSKYHAKSRVRELMDVPETRCFKELV
jgi:hypothetical protein